MKSIPMPNNVNMKGKIHKLLSCGCCEMVNFKKTAKRWKYKKDFNKFYV